MSKSKINANYLLRFAEVNDLYSWSIIDCFKASEKYAQQQSKSLNISETELKVLYTVCGIKIPKKVLLTLK